MSDLLSLLLLIEKLSTSITRTTVLIQRMRDEGRETLTDEEKAQLQSEDDDARDQLLQAIQDAKVG